MWCVLDMVLVPSHASSMWDGDMCVCLKQAAWHVTVSEGQWGWCSGKPAIPQTLFPDYQVNECQLFKPQAPADMISHSWYKIAQVKSRSCFYKFCQVDQWLTMGPISHWCPFGNQMHSRLPEVTPF